MERYISKESALMICSVDYCMRLQDKERCTFLLNFEEENILCRVGLRLPRSNKFENDLLSKLTDIKRKILELEGGVF
ncbi:hypothetical protein FCV19_13430 [Clostridium botulinum]|nr:hypothetical protein [Clostridium botulinum]